MKNQESIGIVPSKDDHFSFDIRLFKKTYGTTRDRNEAVKMRDALLTKCIADPMNCFSIEQMTELKLMRDNINKSSHKVAVDKNDTASIYFADDRYNQIKSNPPEIPKKKKVPGKEKQKLDSSEPPLIFNASHAGNSKVVDELNSQDNSDQQFLTDIIGMLQSEGDNSPAHRSEVENSVLHESDFNLDLDSLINYYNAKDTYLDNDILNNLADESQDSSHNNDRDNGSKSNKRIKPGG